MQLKNLNNGFDCISKFVSTIELYIKKLKLKFWVESDCGNQCYATQHVSHSSNFYTSTHFPAILYGNIISQLIRMMNN